MIDLKNIELRTNLSISLLNPKRWERWKKYYYQTGKMEVIEPQMSRRVKKHIKKNYFRKLIFKL